ncbi:hypothetical protein HYQ45_017404 [Verticillium longisporum]|uniref:Uncharacterized protein n=1 Tax=Verticillium longisporum TaxID=100787 RepID=A0A8I2Z5Q6_VERLO|nr:hypothetical protein HYQ45_017404 [Verticillium longisporum]KAG7120484.1 hypothetical protein HYQ44_004980 [Verticillium longisporum]KAG7150755.1 hypothetical protein HYQ46_000292 [Verticillium longisporum]
MSSWRADKKGGMGGKGTTDTTTSDGRPVLSLAATSVPHAPTSGPQAWTRGRLGKPGGPGIYTVATRK